MKYVLRILFVTIAFLTYVRSEQVEAQMHFILIRDTRTGVQFKVPNGVELSESVPEEAGSNWSSKVGHLSIDALNYGATRMLNDLFESMKTKPGRTVLNQEHRKDSFYLQGNEDNGTTEFYIRVEQRNGEVRGVAIAYDVKKSERLNSLAKMVISSCDLFASRSAMSVTAPSPKTDIALSSDAPSILSNAGITQNNLDVPVEIVAPSPLSSNIISVVVSRGQDRFVASADEDGIVKIWDIPTGRFIRDVARIDTENKFWQLLGLSGDGHRLVGVVLNDVVLWDTVKGQELVRVKNAAEEKSALDHSVWLNAAGNRLVIRSENKPPRVFDGLTGSELTVRSDAVDVTFSNDGDSGAMGLSNGSIYNVDKLAESYGRPLVTLLSPVKELAFSPKGKSLEIVAATGGILVWSSVERKLTLHFEPDLHGVGVFSSDGEAFAFQSSDGTFQLYDPLNGALKANLKSPRANLSLVGVSKDNNKFYFSDTKDSKSYILDGRTHVLADAPGSLLGEPNVGLRYSVSSIDDSKTALQLNDIETGETVRSFGDSGSAGPAAISLKGNAIAVFSENGPKIVDPMSGQLVAKCEADSESGHLSAMQFSNNGQLLAHGGDGKRIVLCDATTGATLPGFAGFESDLTALAFSPNDRLLLSGYVDGSVRLWDVATKALLKTFVTGQDHREISKLSFSPDGAKFFAGTDDNRIHIWEARTGRELNTLRVLLPVTAMTVSQDGHRVAAGPQYELSVKQWDVETGKQLLKLTSDQAGRFTSTNDVRYSPFSDGTLIAAAKNRIIIWNIDDGSIKLDISHRNSDFVRVSYTEDEQRIISVDRAGVIRHWDRRTGALLLTVISFENDEWIRITPEGFFDSSLNGASYLSVVNGLKIYSIRQFYQSLYRPDLVREKVSGDVRGLVRMAASRLEIGKAIASGDAPDVNITFPGQSSGAVTAGRILAATAVVNDRGGGVGRIEWRVNGVVVGVDTQLSGNTPLQVPRNVVLEAGDNVIQVTAYNRANLVASEPSQIHVTAQLPTALPNSQADQKPKLFVLIAGINKYADERIQLNFAVPDAKEVARGFRQAAADFYQSVDINLMTDADVNAKNLDAAFNAIKQKTSERDVFVFYLAGHGKTIEGRYYFIPQDIEFDGELTSEIIEPSVKAHAISQEQWQGWFASVPARKSLILFDTCESGTLIGDAGDTQALEKSAANDRLAEATGRSILTAASGSQEALEGYRGHGLFTLELLDAINRGDSDGNGKVDVNELAAFVYAQVTEISARIYHQRQSPQIRLTSNFPLVRPTQILPGEFPPVEEPKALYQVADNAELQIMPGSGAAVVRRLAARASVSIIEKRNGWALIAKGGMPIGYVSERDLRALPQGSH